MSALSVVLRLARRDARRSKGRSALVVAMIALPVLGVGAADVLWRTFELSDAQHATRDLGTADGRLEDTGARSVDQYPGRQAGYSTSNEQRSGAAPAPSTVLPSGTVVVPLREQAARVSTDRSVSLVDVSDLDYSAPLAQGMVRQQEGRAARTPDEVVLSRALADRLDVGLGDRVQVAVSSGSVPEPYSGDPGSAPDGARRSRTVVGLADDPDAVSTRQVWLSPGQLTGSVTRWLVDLPGTLTWDDVRRANAAGFLLQPRGDVPGQPPPPFEDGTGLDASTATAATLVVGMTLLEVVLLAGPAFAVGAKRRTRELALLSATGAEPRDVRRTVLAGGLVLGGVGGLVGVVLGTGLAAACTPLFVDLGGVLPGPFEVRPLELLALVAVGALTATAAAVLPARVAARQDVVAALTGRRGSVRSSRRTPVLGLAATLLGAGVALAGASQRSVNLILAGSATAELGLVATTPFLVGLVGRLSVLLPLGPRLALRDATRNRGRTAPAVSAILAAVAGSVAVATYFASTDRFEREQYSPSAPYGSTWTYVDPTDAAAASAVARAFTRELPDARVRTVQVLPDYPVDDAGKDLSVRIRPACDGQVACQGGSASVFGQVAVGDVELVRDLSGASDLDAARDVLARGGAVVAPFYLRPDGTALLDLTRQPSEGPEEVVRTVAVPAVTLDGDVTPTVVSAEAARRTGLTPRTAGVFAAASTPPSGQQEDHLRGALEQAGIDGGVSIERGYQHSYGLGLLALLVGSAVIVLGASGIATGLAAADGRADLATLAAVGASPRTRRDLAGFQSAVTAGLGTLLGTVAGLVPAIAMVRALNASRDAAATYVATVVGERPGLAHYPLVVPWTNVLVTLLVVPALAALAAWLLTRSRLPLVARLS